MIARQYSSEHSETVKALILLNSPHRVTENEKNEILNRSLDLKKKGPGSSVEAAIERWFSPQFQKENKHIIDLVKVWINVNEKDVYSNIYKLLYYGSIGLQDLKDDKPSLILTCDQDFANGPSTCRKIAKNFQNSEVCILRGLRHMALVENYSLVSRKIVSFIDNL
jgi:3-oxoadipate enol-lactonase/4-carboxymuconolactone decarboxylase